MVAMMVGAVLIVPASGLRLACAGASCDSDGSQASGPVPYCSLPAETRRLITAGFYDGRSPEVLGVTSVADAVSLERSDLVWPSVDTDDRVPLVFSGDGLHAAGPLPAGTRVDRIAPTLARSLRFERPYPMLERSEPIGEVTTNRTPRLVVEVGLKGIGTRDLEAAPQAWPSIAGLLRDGVGTLEASVGSTPLDPAAVLTTIGTGSQPSEHGITGTWIRDWDGRMVSAWSPGSPVSAIATLAEDFEQRTDQQPLVGLIAGASTDRGLIGGGWYVDHDRDVLVREPKSRSIVQRALRITAAEGFGDDPVSDMLGVVLDGSIGEVDRSLGRLVDGLRAIVDAPVLFAVVGTGSLAGTTTLGSADVEQVVRSSVGDVLEGEVPGGVFIDGDRLASAGATRQDVRDALMALVDESGGAVMADAFLSYSVSFGGYC